MATTLGGYEIVREIARSNDIVYEARDPAMNRRIALKELALPPTAAGAERRERVERFYREARAAGNLSHPNIVTVFKVGEDAGRHFIAMEFLEGETLRNRLQIGGPLPIQQAIDIATQVLGALEYAHQHGVVHRDVKPENIQILPGGVAKLTDFGIARMGSEPGITQAGQVFGTPSYMSPEQIAGRTVDHRSDLFAMGVMLYEMLTGRKPFTGDSLVTITYNIMNMDPAPPFGVSPHLQAVIRRALSKTPEQRFSSAAEMLRALKDPGPATPFPPTQHVSAMGQPWTTPGGVTNNYGAGSHQGGPNPGYAGAASSAAGPMSYGPAAGGGVLLTGAGSPPGFLPPLPQGTSSLLPPSALPPPPALPAAKTFREIWINQGPFLSLIGMVLVFMGIAVLVFWVISSGYQGAQNQKSGQGLPPAASTYGTSGSVAPGGSLPIGPSGNSVIPSPASGNDAGISSTGSPAGAPNSVNRSTVASPARSSMAFPAPGGTPASSGSRTDSAAFNQVRQDYSAALSADREGDTSRARELYDRTISDYNSIELNGPPPTDVTQEISQAQQRFNALTVTPPGLSP